MVSVGSKKKIGDERKASRRGAEGEQEMIGRRAGDERKARRRGAEGSSLKLKKSEKIKLWLTP